MNIPVTLLDNIHVPVSNHPEQDQSASETFSTLFDMLMYSNDKGDGATTNKRDHMLEEEYRLPEDPEDKKHKGSPMFVFSGFEQVKLMADPVLANPIVHESCIKGDQIEVPVPKLPSRAIEDTLTDASALTAKAKFTRDLSSIPINDQLTVPVDHVTYQDAQSVVLQQLVSSVSDLKVTVADSTTSFELSVVASHPFLPLDEVALPTIAQSIETDPLAKGPSETDSAGTVAVAPEASVTESVITMPVAPEPPGTESAGTIPVAPEPSATESAITMLVAPEQPVTDASVGETFSRGYVEFDHIGFTMRDQQQLVNANSEILLKFQRETEEFVVSDPSYGKVGEVAVTKQTPELEPIPENTIKESIFNHGRMTKTLVKKIIANDTVHSDVDFILRETDNTATHTPKTADIQRLNNTVDQIKAVKAENPTEDKGLQIVGIRAVAPSQDTQDTQDTTFGHQWMTEGQPHTQLESVQNSLVSESVREHVIDQIVDRLHVQVQQGHNEVQIQLKPDELGLVSIRIALEQGVFTAEFNAENQVVKEIIATQLPQLRSNLEQMGIDIGQMSVGVGNGEGYQHPQQNQERKMYDLANMAREQRRIAGNRKSSLPSLRGKSAYSPSNRSQINLRA